MIRNIFALIPGRYKKGLLPLTISMIFKTVIDLAGLALIIPFLMLLLDNGNLEKIPVLKEIYECMGIGGIAPFASLIIILLLIDPLAELTECILNSSNRVVVTLVDILQDCKSTNLSYNSCKQSFCFFGIISY